MNRVTHWKSKGGALYDLVETESENHMHCFIRRKEAQEPDMSLVFGDIENFISLLHFAGFDQLGEDGEPLE